MSLGTNIKKFRKEMGLTQEELAAQLYVTSQAVSKWESEAGLPDTAQILPIAKALNVTTDALFGIESNDNDVELAAQVSFEANTIRDTGDQIQGAIASVEFLDKKCEENPFNYGIQMRFVQGIAHLSRFVRMNGVFGGETDSIRWENYVKTAKNRALQVIRYSNDKNLVDKTNYAMGWVCWHEGEYDKGREYLNELPSIKSNMLQETLISYYVYNEKGLDGWRDSVRDNFQNFVRAINKQIVYCAESNMWKESLEETVSLCKWGLGIMEQFMQNKKMRAHCQGFYRDTVKYMVAAYLRNGKPKEAAAEWNVLYKKVDEYLAFCKKVNEANPEEVIKEYGEKSAYNMAHYDEEFVQSKKTFMLGQLKSWCDGKVWEKFEKLI